MQRFHNTDEECNQSIFLTEDRGNNGGGMDDSTHLDGAIQGDTTGLGSRHKLERSTGGKYTKEVSTSKYSWSSIESPLRMNKTGHWSGKRCVLINHLDEGADAMQVCAISNQVRVCAVIGW